MRSGAGAGGANAPQKFWFVENSGKTAGTWTSTFLTISVKLQLFVIECINRTLLCHRKHFKNKNHQCLWLTTAPRTRLLFRLIFSFGRLFGSWGFVCLHPPDWARLIPIGNFSCKYFLRRRVMNGTGSAAVLINRGFNDPGQDQGRTPAYLSTQNSFPHQHKRTAASCPRAELLHTVIK